MRTSTKYIAALLGILAVLVSLLRLPKWPPSSLPKHLTAAVVRVADNLHTLFALVRYYRPSLGYTALLIQYSTYKDTYSYEIVLHPGYLIEAYKSSIGPTHQITLENPRIKGYFAELDKATLQRVRADVSVERVL
jgi:hypothetical protein